MKLNFRHQKFQADAARAVADVFAGQPYSKPSPALEETGYISFLQGRGCVNKEIVPALSDQRILEQLNRVQRTNQIEPSRTLEGRYNLSVEMETGVGKTYTYIKTMFELSKRYGWNKFIVVVPSVAIREGVYKTFQMTREHFMEDYGQPIRFFIYDSSQLPEVEYFASDSFLHVMIINSQAFNARGQDARRIYMEMDSLNGWRPIDVIAGTRPIVIIDEPQSVEGPQTRERLKEFHPLMTLRYSATHKKGCEYNMVYRLDAMDAYNRQLVKKISVKGISASNALASGGYVYLEGLNLSRDYPTASIRFDCKRASGVRQKTAAAREGFNLYERSGGLDEYRNNYIIKSIDGRDNSVELLNGIKLYAGDVAGAVDEDRLRRIQIRETILTHIERERQLYARGIKVLSLFFIDEVAKYRLYDDAGRPADGLYARMFQEEYEDVVSGLQLGVGEEEYLRYLNSIPVQSTHAGYFSVDKKGKLTDGKLGDRQARTSDDVNAYDLIMRSKERLLELDPVRSPVRFIFSHSALREGWDNPNVFQICILKQSRSDIRKRQEVGRGMRLCVNRFGDRMDAEALKGEVHSVNVLTIIASESYDSFARDLQRELSDAVASRPRTVTPELFAGRALEDIFGNRQIVDEATARAIQFDLSVDHYVDRTGHLTDKYYAARVAGTVKIAEEAADMAPAILSLLDSVYNERIMCPDNARGDNVKARVREEKLAMPAFRELWELIRRKSAYAVSFDEEQLRARCIGVLNRKLRVSRVYFQVESGSMEKIRFQESLREGTAFRREGRIFCGPVEAGGSSVKYDLVGRLVEETKLTRAAVAAVLTGIDESVFDQFRSNPEEFIIRAAALINDEKARAVVKHIVYHPLDERFSDEILTRVVLKGWLGENAMKANRHLYDHVIYDSSVERDFAQNLEILEDVEVYVKLPQSFYISTPVGRYSPDWAVVLRRGTDRRLLVVETKGSVQELQLREIEQTKLHCAQEHFRAISGGEVIFGVVDSVQGMMDLAGF